MTVAVTGCLISSLVFLYCTEQNKLLDSTVKVYIGHCEGLERICCGLFQDAVQKLS